MDGTEGRDIAPTRRDLALIRDSIKKTALRFNERLSPDSIEDLVQEVFLRLWRLGAEEKLGRCPTYVWRVAVNVTIDAIRRNRAKKRTLRSRRCSVEMMYPPTPTPEEIILAREELQLHLAQCRALLSRRAYRAFVLVCMVGFPRREVTSLVGMQPRSIDTMLSHLRRRFVTTSEKSRIDKGERYDRRTRQVSREGKACAAR